MQGSPTPTLPTDVAKFTTQLHCSAPVHHLAHQSRYCTFTTTMHHWCEFFCLSSCCFWISSYVRLDSIQHNFAAMCVACIAFPTHTCPTTNDGTNKEISYPIKTWRSFCFFTTVKVHVHCLVKNNTCVVGEELPSFCPDYSL